MRKNVSGTKVKYIKEEPFEALATPPADTRNKNLQDPMARDAQSDSMLLAQSSHLQHHSGGFLKREHKEPPPITQNPVLQFNIISVGIHCP